MSNRGTFSSLAGDIHQTSTPQGLLHATESRDLATPAEGHPAAGVPRPLRQNVLSLRGQGLHEAGSHGETLPW